MIIQCPECNGKVSDQAGSCPHCGVRIVRGFLGGARAAPRESAVDKGVKIGVGLFIVLPLLLMAGGFLLVILLAALSASQ